MDVRAGKRANERGRGERGNCILRWRDFEVVWCCVMCAPHMHGFPSDGRRGQAVQWGCCVCGLAQHARRIGGRARACYERALKKTSMPPLCFKSPHGPLMRCAAPRCPIYIYRYTCSATYGAAAMHSCHARRRWCLSPISVRPSKYMAGRMPPHCARENTNTYTHPAPWFQNSAVRSVR